MPVSSSRVLAKASPIGDNAVGLGALPLSCCPHALKPEGAFISSIRSIAAFFHFINLEANSAVGSPIFVGSWYHLVPVLQFCRFPGFGSSVL
ncbi:hypothetical protein AXF42_Ash014297 [Apostasia shenzhenica]|uniref:Uncharacterized protein n=1 Tax=Apostasia shenzhenica TaxID=1088818 RepID=A0A2I0B0R2_9ASPA|nr:hypothetical protein AXF42_Ash014297 [Apostasia shenzhenica]